MFTEAVTGALTAAEIYEKRATLAQLVKSFVHTFLHGHTNVGVVGAGGTGKTTFGQFMSGELDTDKAVAEYIETIGTDKFKVSDNRSTLLTVVPGQQRRRENKWPEIYQGLSSGKSIRLINVVAWGFHASQLEKVRHRAYREGMTDDDFREAYVIDSLEEELNALREIVPHLKSAKGKLRMITLVTKQDLWWKQRHIVEDYYSKGEYSKILSEVSVAKGGTGFSHELLSCALVEQNLRMADGFSLVETAGGYDDAFRVANLALTVRSLNQFVGE